MLLTPLLLTAFSACAEELPETPPRQLPAEETPFQYPEELWDAGVEGQTLLRLFVSVGGQVDTIRVERTSGYPAFDSAAVTGAGELRFEPAQRGPDPIDAWVLLPVEFDLPSPDTASEGAP